MQYPLDLTIHQEIPEQAKVSRIMRWNSLIGSGGQGRVYDGSLYPGLDTSVPSKRVGIKSIDGGINEEAKKTIMRQIMEFTFAKRLNKCNGMMRYLFIVIPESFYKDEEFARLRRQPILFYHESRLNKIYIGMSLAPGQSLRSAIDASKTNGNYTYNLVAVFNSIIASLQCMHNENIVHGDLKPENIMIHGDESTIIDYGSMCPIERCRLPPGAFTPEYTPVEVFNAGKRKARGMHTFHADNIQLYKKYDIFSLGCILYEMLCLRKIFDNFDTIDQWNGKTNTVTASLVIDVENPQIGWKQLIIDCINPDPRERPELNKAFMDRVAALPVPDFALFTGLAPAAAAAAAAANAEGGALRRKQTRRRRAPRRSTYRRRQ